MDSGFAIILTFQFSDCSFIIFNAMRRFKTILNRNIKKISIYLPLHLFYLSLGGMEKLASAKKKKIPKYFLMTYSLFHILK